MAKTSAPKGVGKVAMDADMTIYSAGQQKERLIEALERVKVLELDLSRVGEIDTAGIQLLILAKRESQRLGRELRIVAHSPAVQDLIEFYNLGGFFGDPLVIPAQAAG